MNLAKLDQFSQDIVDFLKKNEPNMLRWSDIVEGLLPHYKAKYKNLKGFGVALTQKLKPLLGEWIKKEGHLYGGLNSKLPKPRIPNQPTMGKWEYKKWEKQYEDEQRRLEIKRLKCEDAIDTAIMNLKQDDPDYLKKKEKIRVKNLRKYGFL